MNLDPITNAVSCQCAIITALFCAPATAATLHPFVIEAADCGTIYTRHEPIAGPVLMGERGSRKYVCGHGLPPNPYPYDTLADLKGHHEKPAPLAPSVGQIVVLPGMARATGGTHAWGETPGAKSYAWVPPFSHTHTREPWKPETEPQPVPLPASVAFLLTALVGLYGTWRARK